MAAYFFFYTAQNVPLPILPLYNVNVLKLTDGEISLGSALYYLMTMLTSLALGMIAYQLSHRKQLLIGGLLTGQYPLLMASMGMEAIKKYAETKELPANTEGLDFFNTGAVLITDKPVEGLSSISADEGLEKCWG